MNNSVIREFYPNLLQKGYTCQEIRQGSSKTSEVKEVPDWAKSRYDTYDEYLDGLHDFMNGMQDSKQTVTRIPQGVPCAPIISKYTNGGFLNARFTTFWKTLLVR